MQNGWGGLGGGLAPSSLVVIVMAPHVHPASSRSRRWLVGFPLVLVLVPVFVTPSSSSHLACCTPFPPCEQLLTAAVGGSFIFVVSRPPRPRPHPCPRRPPPSSLSLSSLAPLPPL